ncbi:MAG: 30S ribosomal protein S17 [Planctomycetaceae bacterium]
MRKRLVGVVTSDKMNKSRRVEIERTYRHAKYGKTMRARTICHVHDENNESKTGDLVEIEESRPLSRLKHWTLVKIVKTDTVPEKMEV